jgi:hypothetical protein
VAIYIILFVIPLIAILLPLKAKKDLNFSALLLLAIVLIIVIGARHNVGGDWDAYLAHYYETYGLGFSEGMSNNNMSDIGYVALNWIAGQLDLGIYGVNFIAGIVFITGLFVFSLRMPLPWMALIVAIPFLYVVVAMGYTRQSLAIGFEFFALIALSNYKFLTSMFSVIVGALFHKTLIMLLPLTIIASKKRRRFLKVLIIIFSVSIAGYLLLLDYIKHYIVYYIDNSKHSDGGLIRVLMNALPGLVYLVYYKRWHKIFNAEKVWLIFSISSLIFIPLSLFASTAVDRVSLYLIPLQIYVWSHFPMVIENKILRGAIIVFVIITYAAVLLTWLNFSRYSNYWVPYQSILF